VIHNYGLAAELGGRLSRNTTIWKSGSPKALLSPCPPSPLEGDANGAPHPETRFLSQTNSPANTRTRTINGGIGHNLPQEAPQAFAQAVIDADHFVMGVSRARPGGRTRSAGRRMRCFAYTRAVPESANPAQRLTSY